MKGKKIQEVMEVKKILGSEVYPRRFSEQVRSARNHETMASKIVDEITLTCPD